MVEYQKVKTAKRALFSLAFGTILGCFVAAQSQAQDQPPTEKPSPTRQSEPDQDAEEFAAFLRYWDHISSEINRVARDDQETASRMRIAAAEKFGTTVAELGILSGVHAQLRAELDKIDSQLASTTRADLEAGKPIKASILEEFETRRRNATAAALSSVKRQFRSSSWTALLNYMEREFRNGIIRRTL